MQGFKEETTMARTSMKQKAFRNLVEEFEWFYYYDMKLEDGDAGQQKNRVYHVFFAYNDIDLLSFRDLDDAKEKAKENVKHRMACMETA